MNKIPSAEEMFEAWQSKYKTSKPCILDGHTTVAIEFAKLHIEAALKAASETVRLMKEEEFTYKNGRKCRPYKEIREKDIESYSSSEGVYDDRFTIFVDKESILNAYPLTNIK